MKKELIIKNKKIVYFLKKSKKAKHLRLSVGRRAEVLITIPYRAKEKDGLNFLLEKSDWILEKISDMENNFSGNFLETEENDYLRYKKLALEIVVKKIEYFNRFYNFSFERVSVRNQKSCWGSCSGRKNLNFNFRLIFLSEELCNYVIVHELCHLKELNHSERFWCLVEKSFPDYKNLRKKLRKIR